MKFTYRAFISYSHEADGKLCPAIQSALHRFAKAWYQLRAMKVFRDRASLSPGPVLGRAIEEALGASEYLLLLASPQSARSHWVQREIDWWIKNRPLDRLVIILTSGELVWDRRATDFDWTRTTALPELLRGSFRDEPLYVDFRWADDPDKLSLRHTQFRAAILDIAATLRGIPKDELDGEDVRQHRRTRIVATVAILGILTFAVAAAWQAYVANVQRRQAEQARQAESEQRQRADAAAADANNQRDEATRQRDLAVRREREATEERRVATYQRNIAFSRMLAAQSLQSTRNPLPHLDLALLQGVAADRTQSTPESRRSIVNALLSANRVKRFVHTPNTLVSLALSPDGRTIATGGFGGQIVLWDAATLQQRSNLDNGKEVIDGLAFSPDGRTLAAVARASVALWDVSSGKKRHVLAGDGRMTVVAWHPDGTTVFSNGAGVLTWDAVTGARRTQSGALARASRRRLAVGPDGKTIVTADDEPGITLWDVATGEPRQTLVGHRRTVTALAFSRDGSLLASGGDDGTIVIWDASGEKRETLEKHTDPVDSLAFSPDGKSLASGSRNRLIIVWDLARSEPTEVLVGHTNSVQDIVFSPDGRELVSAAFGSEFVVWNLGVPRQLALLKGHTAGVRTVAVSPDGTTFASGSDDATVRLWDAVSGQERAVLKGHRGEVMAIAFSPTQWMLASGGEDRRIRFWDTTSGRLIQEIDAHGEITSLAFNPDGKTLAWAVEGTLPIFLWDIATRHERAELVGHETNADSLQFSHDGKVLVSAGGNTIRAWDPLRGREIAEPMQAGTIVKVALSPDGRTVASSQTWPQSVLLWDLYTDKDPVELPDQSSRSDKSPAFSANGRMLAYTAGEAGLNVVFFNLADGRTWTLEAPSTVQSITFTPDGKRLVTGHSNGQIGLWDADVENWLHRACEIANRNLTRQEWKTFLGAELPYQTVCPGLAIPPD